MSDEGRTALILVTVSLFSIIDGVEYFKNKKKDKEETPSSISSTVKKEEKKENKPNVEFVARDPIPVKKEVTPKKTAPTPIKKAAPKVKVTPVVKQKVVPQKSEADIFFDKHVSPSFVSDAVLLNDFNYFNQRFFDNQVKINSISFVDFNNVPGVSKEEAQSYRGQTHYRYSGNKECFIIISQRFQNSLNEYRATLAHEMIHAYIFEKYIKNNPSSIEVTFYKDQNANHKGIFKEIEYSLIKRGLPLNEDYIHCYDENYLEKHLSEKY